MPTVYKSKISLIIWIPIVFLVAELVGLFLLDVTWLAFIISFLIIGFLIHMIVTTYYTIRDNILNVHCGFFYNTDIAISSITAIAETNSMLSAPALSADRIEIFYNTYDSIIISPPSKMDFINHLVRINSAIEVKLKQKN